MTESDAEAREPPQPPTIAPKLRMWRIEFVGMLLIAALPALALLGAFGPDYQETRVRSGSIEMVVEHPTRVRFQTHHRFKISVRNLERARTLDVTVNIDPGYVEAFSEVTSMPAAERPYVFQLDNIAPGESRAIALEARAKQFGSHAGRISFIGDESGQVRIETFVFP